MVTEIVMPDLSTLDYKMEKGVILKWFKKEGEDVAKGENLFKVETLKAIMDIESPYSGKLAKIMAQEGSVVKPGGVIGLIEPGGTIVKGDVLKAVEAAGTIEDEGALRTSQGAPPPSGEVRAMSFLRKIIAERMLRSQLTTAHVTLTMTVDMTEASELRQKLLEDVEKMAGIRISYNDIVARAVAMSLRDHPLLHSSIEGENVKISDDINLGIAVATEEGLMVPVLRNADRKSLIEIASTTNGLVEKVKTRTASIDEVTGGTFTLTNLGMFGVETFTPIINPPEAAILGVGRITETPAVVNGQIVVRSMMSLSLTVDHRVIDGDVGARFLQRVKKILEEPYLLLV